MPDPWLARESSGVKDRPVPAGVGGRAARRAMAVLREALEGEDPLVREHGARALEQTTGFGRPGP